MTVRVIGIGQPVAGDDGVGHAVLDALAAMDLPADVEISRIREASGLVPLLADVERVVLVDAVVAAGAPGTVQLLDPQALATGAMSGVSSHGIGVLQAIELARILSTDDIDDIADVRVVAVSIEAPQQYQIGLSPDIAAAVPRAARAVIALCRLEPHADSPQPE